MTPELKQFILKNKDIINQNSKKSWEEIYDNLSAPTLKGEYTTIMLSVGIDPAKILCYIPTSYLYRSKIANYKIPDNATSIGNRAFFICANLTSVVIPDSVTTIGERAFFGCSSLTSVEIPDSVTSIGDGAFCYCDSLKEIIFKGAKKQAMQLGIGNRSRKRWREGSSIEKIICTDGEIIL